MFAIIQNGEIVKTIDTRSQLIINGVDYGFNWIWDLSTERLMSLGVVEILEPTEPDQRFYWVGDQVKLINGKPVREYTTTPKDLDKLKTQYVQETKQNANITLAQTDWIVLRKFERGIDIPTDVVESRAKIISDCAQKESAILASTTVEELIAVLYPTNIQS